ncbi:MAG: hypothetical protein M1823_003227 [Watsoniomyces obsoletus]|nr:MAG: hypothetical protein M1823_003227 [Watsoniomyces obsoletus]
MSVGKSADVDMDLVVGTVENPVNREPPITDLVSRPIPHIDATRHRVRVDGCVNHILDLSISQLQNDFPQHEVICALQCAGNRRHTMRTKLKEVAGVDWGDGAVMNCRWRGPRLRDVLNRAGVALPDPKTAHIAFACFATPCQDDDWYGASIELERGMSVDGEVILALEMNGQPLPIPNGFPVRIIAPGIAGARSVKWLDRITVQQHESRNYYQQHDYKILPSEAVDWEVAERYWHTVPSVQDMPINSVIAIPSSGDVIQVSPDDKTFEVKGYALPQGDQGPVSKVEVSLDDGRHWTNAKITHGGFDQGYGKWCSALWRVRVPVPDGWAGRVVSRATDVGGNIQPEESKWNLRGVNYNGFGEVVDLKVVV